jgi:hypothetical protein
MPKPSVIRFGPFAADLGSGELRREGVKVRLQSFWGCVLGAETLV